MNSNNFGLVRDEPVGLPPLGHSFPMCWRGATADEKALTTRSATNIKNSPFAFFFFFQINTRHCLVVEDMVRLVFLEIFGSRLQYDQKPFAHATSLFKTFFIAAHVAHRNNLVDHHIVNRNRKTNTPPEKKCHIHGMVWYGMVWYGMVWYGMVWYGMVWYGMVWTHYMCCASA